MGGWVGESGGGNGRKKPGSLGPQEPLRCEAVAVAVWGKERGRAPRRAPAGASSKPPEPVLPAPQARLTF